MWKNIVVIYAKVFYQQLSGGNKNNFCHIRIPNIQKKKVMLIYQGMLGFRFEWI
jgi:hypothetical protein